IGSSLVKDELQRQDLFDCAALLALHPVKLVEALSRRPKLVVLGRVPGPVTAHRRAQVVFDDRVGTAGTRVDETVVRSATNRAGSRHDVAIHQRAGRDGDNLVDLLDLAATRGQPQLHAIDGRSARVLERWVARRRLRVSEALLVVTVTFVVDGSVN